MYMNYISEHQAFYILTHWGEDKMALFADDNFECSFVDENV